MSVQATFYILLAGVVTLLLIASSVAWLLGKRTQTEGGRTVVANLQARIRAWWGMIAILVVAYLLGQTTTLVLFALLSFFALREFITLTPTRPGDHAALSLAFFVLIPVQYYLIGIDWYSLFAIFVPVYGFLLLPSFTSLAQDTEGYLERTSKIQWGVMISIYCVSHAPALLMLEIPGYHGKDVLLLFYLLLVVQLSDVMQYIFGKLFGRTHIAPVVSPSKTREGFLYGGAAAVAIGTAMWWITPFTPWQAAGISYVIVLMGFLGGLVLSAVKRSLGAKDWGNMIEGHGGTLDRLDSISFAAPIFFHLTRYFFT
jgi:phosphatidate cytidylyltransferase